MSMTRDPGKITKTYWDGDHDVWWIAFEGDEGCQSFGGLALGPPLEAEFRKELIELFGASSFEDLQGRYCFALRCFAINNEPIEGFERNGRRWTLTGFRRRHFPDKTIANRLAQRKDSCVSAIASAETRIRAEKEELQRLDGMFVDWEKETPMASADNCAQCRDPNLKNLHTCLRAPGSDLDLVTNVIRLRGMCGAHDGKRACLLPLGHDGPCGHKS